MSTKVKTEMEIAEVRRLKKNGMSMRAIAKKMRFSKNTVKKIVYQVNGYEGNIFNCADRWKGRQYNAPIYVSQIDGEKLHYQKPTSADYPRVTTIQGRMGLHIYEAKKAYRILRLVWPRQAVVHHRDYDKENLLLDNLVVFNNTGSHLRHHANFEKAMYNFLQHRDLFNEFCIDNPTIKLRSLSNMLETKRKSVKAKEKKK